MPALFLLAIFLLFAPHAAAIEADTTFVGGRDYYSVVNDSLQSAKESIYVVMYQVSLRPYDKTTKVYKLIEELIRAKERGIEVKVILDQNINFVTG